MLTADLIIGNHFSNIRRSSWKLVLREGSHMWHPSIATVKISGQSGGLWICIDWSIWYINSHQHYHTSPNPPIVPLGTGRDCPNTNMTSYHCSLNFPLLAAFIISDTSICAYGYSPMSPSPTEAHHTPYKQHMYIYLNHYYNYIILRSLCVYTAPTMCVNEGRGGEDLYSHIAHIDFTF